LQRKECTGQFYKICALIKLIFTVGTLFGIAQVGQFTHVADHSSYLGGGQPSCYGAMPYIHTNYSVCTIFQLGSNIDHGLAVTLAAIELASPACRLSFSVAKNKLAQVFYGPPREK